MPALIDNFTKEELAEIVKNSTNMREVIKKIGYNATSGSNNRTVKSRLEKYGIDYSHFTSNILTKVIRSEENVFIENSTATQKVLREWYKKGNYTKYKCSICGQEPIWQGKDLTLILDHINGHNHDDRLENLRWVCPNCNQQLDTTGFKNKIKLNQEEFKNDYFLNQNLQSENLNNNYCIDCGKKISKKSIRCNECESKHRIIPLENMPITREELKGLIRTLPFTTIALRFGVTDNAIRKWCDKFNLPRSKKEIQNYSDKEWALI